MIHCASDLAATDNNGGCHLVLANRWQRVMQTPQPAILCERFSSHDFNSTIGSLMHRGVDVLPVAPCSVLKWFDELSSLRRAAAAGQTHTSRARIKSAAMYPFTAVYIDPDPYFRQLATFVLSAAHVRSYTFGSVSEFMSVPAPAAIDCVFLQADAETDVTVAESALRERGQSAPVMRVETTTSLYDVVNRLAELELVSETRTA